MVSSEASQCEGQSSANECVPMGGCGRGCACKCALIGTAARSHGSLRYQGQSMYACLSEVEVIERVPFTYIVKDRGKLVMS